MKKRKKCGVEWVDIVSLAAGWNSETASARPEHRTWPLGVAEPAIPPPYSGNMDTCSIAYLPARYQVVRCTRHLPRHTRGRQHTGSIGISALFDSTLHARMLDIVPRFIM